MTAKLHGTADHVPRRQLLEMDADGDTAREAELARDWRGKKMLRDFRRHAEDDVQNAGR